MFIKLDLPYASSLAATFIPHTTLFLGDSILEVVNLLKKVLGCILAFHLLSINGFAQTNSQIEIFDIHKGKVIRVLEMDRNIHHKAEKILGDITGVVVKYNPIPNNGYMIRIPLEPNVKVRNQWFVDLVDEVTIIIPDQEKAYLMVVDDENQPHFLTFKGDVAKIEGLLNFQP